jgi:type IV pilus assembly protein PilE
MKTLRKPRISASAGFTLVELMVVIVIATILATIAIPSYRAQIRKSRRTDAKTALLDLAAREERYNSTNNTYTSLPANLGYSGAFPVTVGSGYYQISINVCAALACAADKGTGVVFTATAKAINTQQNDTQCGDYTLDSTGGQAVTGTATPASCWN